MPRESHFYTALFNDSLRELGEAQRQRLAENVSAQSERYQAGQADRGAMTNARLLERELDPRIEEVRRGYQGALLTLATIMGDDLGPDGKRPYARRRVGLRGRGLRSAGRDLGAASRRSDLNLARLLVRAAEKTKESSRQRIIRRWMRRFQAPTFRLRSAPQMQGPRAVLTISFLRK